MKLQFPEPYVHKHPPVRNVNDVLQEHLTPGQRASDQIARVVGSWPFIITQSIVLVFWVALNVLAWINHWDPYPFILLNLFLSLQAAYTAPIIMMSQNRLAARDRLEAHEDYHTNLKAEEEIRVIMNHLAAQDAALAAIHDILVKMQEQPAS